MSIQNVDETTHLLRSPTAEVPTSHSPEDASDIKATHRTTSLAFRIAAAMYSFTITGLFSASIGVLLAPISKHYSLSDLHVSLIFLSAPIGYVLSSSANACTHALFGQRGIAFLGPLLHVLAALGIAAHPPFPVLLGAFIVVAMGTGLVDGSWCAWAGGLEKANSVSGFLHGSYSFGAAIGPFAAGMWMSEAGRAWWEWYYVLAIASLLELFILLSAFRFEDAPRYHAAKHALALPSPTSPSSRAIFKHRATWCTAAYFLTYVGIETAISGWVVSFMSRARHAPPSTASLSSSSYWAGMAIGRLVLGPLTEKCGVRPAGTFYLFAALSFLVLFALASSPTVSIVAMASAGFVQGPMFPSGVVVLSELLPRELHVAAVSFCASVGQVGGAALPFGIGAVVEGLGIRVFPWVIVGFTGVAMGTWGVFARLRPRREEEDNDD